MHGLARCTVSAVDGRSMVGSGPMRVLIGTAWSMKHPGGVQSHIQDLTSALTQRKVDWVFTNPSDSYHRLWCKAFALAAGHDVDRARVLLAQWRLRDLEGRVTGILSKGHFSILHAHDVLAGHVMFKAGLPTVLTVHGPLAREVRMLFGQRYKTFLKFIEDAEARAYTCAHRIIAVDSGQKGLMVNDYGVSPQKIRVIANAVNTDIFVPNTQLVTSGRYLLVPRRLVKKNGVDVALRALPLVKDRALRLAIAGDGPEKSALVGLSRSLGLSKRVVFLGAINDRGRMARLVSSAAGVIVPSVPVEGVVEATSIAALEAMSCGVPVFASRIGGLVEIIRDGETGFLFEAGDWRELAWRVNEVLYGALRDRVALVGRAARAYVERNHSLPVWIEKVLSVYAEVAGV